jgi:hypothetical protein
LNSGPTSHLQVILSGISAAPRRRIYQCGGSEVRIILAARSSADF